MGRVVEEYILYIRTVQDVTVYDVKVGDEIVKTRSNRTAIGSLNTLLTTMTPISALPCDEAEDQTVTIWIFILVNLTSFKPGDVGARSIQGSISLAESIWKATADSGT